MPGAAALWCLASASCGSGARKRMAEAEDFVDFLLAREDNQRLTRAAAKASEASFAQVWDNDEDAAYDRM